MNMNILNAFKAHHNQRTLIHEVCTMHYAMNDYGHIVCKMSETRNIYRNLNQKN